MASAGGFGFTRSAAWRLAGAGAYLVAVGALLLALLGRSGGPPGAPAVAAPPPTAPAQATLTLTATYAVARWTVELDGVAQTPDVVTAQTWQAHLRLAAPGAEVYLHGEPADPLNGGPCALRVSFAEGSHPPRTTVLWGEGGVSARIAPRALGEEVRR